MLKVAPPQTRNSKNSADSLRSQVLAHFFRATGNRGTTCKLAARNLILMFQNLSRLDFGPFLPCDLVFSEIWGMGGATYKSAAYTKILAVGSVDFRPIFFR